jgi:hypothetical protein
VPNTILIAGTTPGMRIRTILSRFIDIHEFLEAVPVALPESGLQKVSVSVPVQLTFTIAVPLTLTFRITPPAEAVRAPDKFPQAS